jgi:hypothetical protein
MGENRVMGLGTSYSSCTDSRARYTRLQEGHGLILPKSLYATELPFLRGHLGRDEVAESRSLFSSTSADSAMSSCHAPMARRTAFEQQHAIAQIEQVARALSGVRQQLPQRDAL